MPRLALYLLGPPRVELDGEPVHIGRRKSVALLAYLAVEGDRHSRDALATLFWPGYDQRTSRAHLRRALATLSKRLGGRWFATDRETVGLDQTAQVWLDVDQFRQRLASSEAHEHPSRAACEECLALLTQAVELYQHDFMAGFTLPDSLAFDEWQRFQTQRLRDELASALEHLASGHHAAGEHDAAIANAQRWLALDPTHEPAHRLLMQLYAETGRRGAALRQYRSCLRDLEDELGLPPSEETTALYEQIRAESLAQRERVAAAAPPAPPPAQAHLPAFLTIPAEPVSVGKAVFVARERELVLLESHLEGALSGQGRVVFVTGGPGRGKTTLMRQFAAQTLEAHDDLLIASGNCNAVSGIGDPYLPFREVLGMLTGDVEARWAAGTLSGAHARRLWAAVPLVAQALVEHGPHLIDTLVSGAPLLDRATATASERPDWLGQLQGWVEREKGAHSDLEQRALFTQFANTLSSLADRRPLLLLLDDLQWADSCSVGMLFHLGRCLADAGGRLLILGAYRPEEVASEREGGPHPLEKVLGEFRRRFGDVWLDLAQADQVQGRRFVEAFLDTEPNQLGEGFRTALSQRTGGHALFTIELLRAMQDKGDLVQDEQGRWTEGAALDWEALPARVEAVVKARVDRLDKGQRDLLAAASVEGEIFTAQVLAQVQGLPAREVLRALSRELGPQGHRLVRQAGEERVAEAGRFLSRYQFAHALFQSYLYHDLSPGERRLLHHEVASVLEALYGADTDAVVVPLAHHYHAAGQTDQAIAYALRAGEHAYRAYANEQAVMYFQRALGLLPPVREDAREEQWRLAALSGLGRVQFRAGEIEAAERYLREAIALGRESEMPLPDLLRLYYWLGEALWWQGRYPEMLRVGEEGLALLGDDVESVEAALMYDTIGLPHFYLGHHADFRKYLKRTAQFLQALPYTEELRAVYVHLGDLHRHDKDVQGAINWLEALEQRATQSQDLRALGSAQQWTGYALWRQGDFRRGLTCYQQAVELFAKIGDEKELFDCYGELTRSYLTLGDLDMAEQYANRALTAAETVGSDYLLQYCFILSGLSALARRSWQAAQDDFETASRHRCLPGDARAIYLLGRTCLSQRDRAAALKQFQDAMTMAGPKVLRQDALFLNVILSGLEEAYEDPEAFSAVCRRYRDENPAIRDSVFAHWYLEPMEPFQCRQSLVCDTFAESLAPSWMWQDPFGDCSYNLHKGLEIRAANGRDLWRINLSAPRLLQPAPEKGDYSIQTVCEPALQDRPAIGGVLLWKDKQNYLRLNRGTRGEREISFRGCIGNQDVIIGRGRLLLDASGRAFLRLERVGDRVRAVCSADGETWFSVGSVAFPVKGPLQVGLHAIGYIDRAIYHGAYPDGTAIRFESFTLWGLER